MVPYVGALFTNPSYVWAPLNSAFAFVNGALCRGTIHPNLGGRLLRGRRVYIVVLNVHVQCPK